MGHPFILFEKGDIQGEKRVRRPLSAATGWSSATSATTFRQRTTTRWFAMPARPSCTDSKATPCKDELDPRVHAVRTAPIPL